MKKINLPGLFLIAVFFLTGHNLFAQDVDLTHLIVNNDFEYQSEGVENPNGTSWKPQTQDPPTTFYGWICDFSILNSTSQGINQDFNLDGVPTNHGVNGCWVGGNCVLPAFYEFYQTIDKESLAAGTYKVQCLLSSKTSKRTSQRLFANRNVQYFGEESSYEMNQTEGETATFAGWEGDYDGHLREMVVYTTIGENDSLKIGIRTGGIKGDGNTAPSANPMWGWIKTDYFRLTKIDQVKAADASLSDITLSAGDITFDPATFTYDVELPAGIGTITVTATPNVPDVLVSGAGDVDVSSGSGVSTIRTTALDGNSTETYTINYVVDPAAGLNAVNAKTFCFVENRKLTVEGVESYAVYNLQGMKVADVKVNASGRFVDLNQGIYIVKTGRGGTFKVIVD